MTRRFPISRRARGERGPQIDDGTFEGRTDKGFTKPDDLSVIVYSPGPLPAVELWCYRTTFEVVGPAAGDAKFMWIDAIPEAEWFQPPQDVPLDDPAALNALRQYASNRYQVKTGDFTDAVSNWKVSIARPFQFLPAGTTAPKIKAGPKGRVYAVFQDAEVGAPTNALLTAWVWAPAEKGREVWLLYARNEPGGFSVVGSQPQGASEPYQSTRLQFKKDQPADIEAYDLTLYGESIERLMQHALAHPQSPALDASDFEVHDYRTSDPFSP